MSYSPQNPAPDPRSRFQDKAGGLVRAAQWFPGQPTAGVRYEPPIAALAALLGHHGYVETPEGGVYAQPGDWIIEAEDTGQLAVCAAADFGASYTFAAQS